MNNTSSFGHATNAGRNLPLNNTCGMRCNRTSVSCIVPPHILRRLIEKGAKNLSQDAFRTLLTTAGLRGERSVRAAVAFAAAPAHGRRTISDCRQGRRLESARIVRTEDGAPSADPAVNRAFDFLGKTRDFYKEVLNRDSIDDRGMRLNGYVHYGNHFQNAFWDGLQMVFGDGDGELFDDFTKSLDVVAHELAHGVTEHTANLAYHNQSGALNESLSDVFGSLVKQWSLNQNASEADWLIGAELFTPSRPGDALRSMKAPGTAYDNDLIGKDPQPDHMDRFDALPDTEDDDFGGVHINSGIPNKAFYLTAIKIGGVAWQAPGQIWYESLKASSTDTQFQEFADTTFSKAGLLFGAGKLEQEAVAEAWREVGIRVAGAPRAARTGVSSARPAWPVSASGADLGLGEAVPDWSARIEALGAELQRVSREVAALRAHA